MAWLQDIMRTFSGASLVVTQGANGMMTLTVPVSRLYPVMLALRDLSSCQFKELTDRASVDYVGRQPRFDVVYQLHSVRYSRRCMVKVCVDELTSVTSVTTRYHSANWAERECYDMMGIRFEGHPDLRRLLSDYGFEGYPRRKDFPLMGFQETRYDESEKRVVSEPVQRAQDLRTYTFGLPWKTLPASPMVKSRS